MAKRGLQAMKEAIDRSKTRFAGSPGGRLNYFTWKDGDRHIIRFLTDDFITTKFYEWVRGADGKKTRDFIVAPDFYEDDPTWNGEDWVLKYGGKTTDFKTKQLVDPKPREMTVGIAVLREEYSDNGTQGVRDKLEKIEVDGQEFPARWFGIVKQAHGNFWDNIMPFYNRYGTLCDRDYEVTRSGDGKDTKYHFFALDKDDALPDEETVQKVYGYGKKINPDDPKRFLYVPQTLDDWATHFASEDRAKAFLLGPNGEHRVVQDDTDDEVAASTTTEADTTDEFALLRKQLIDAAD